MKKIFSFLTKTLLIVSLIFATGCGDDDDNNDPTNPNNNVSDPAGTITANIAEKTYITIRNNEGTTCGYIEWQGPDNFYLSTSSANNVSICNVGPMQGLGNITNIPQSGYTTPQSSNKAVACEAGNGYIIKFEGGILETPQYVRLYIVEPIVSTVGGIMGAKVKYQCPFEPTTLTASKEKVSFNVSKGTESITINTSSPKWTYSCNESWISVAQKDNTLSISVLDNKYIFERTGEIIIQANEKQKIITVVQAPITKTSAPYSIGDTYCESGVIGIVYKTSNNGRNGMLVSLNESYCQWATTNIDTKCSDIKNGINNTNHIKTLPNWEGRFPAFKWCNDLNTGNISGWYLPAKEELTELYAGYCGLSSYPGVENDATSVYKTARTKFNETLINNGGEEIREIYISSTEYDTERTWYQDFRSGSQHYTWKTSMGRSRAVRAF